MCNGPDYLHPSSWARLFGSTSAPVVVVGKDFSSSGRFFKRPRDWFEPDPAFATNDNLRELATTAGMDPARDLYLTNAVLCLKPGGTSAPLRTPWIRNCSSLLSRTVKLIRPRAVVALGEDAWRALGFAFGRDLERWRQRVGGAPEPACGDRPALFCFGHPGTRGRSNRKRADQQRDWCNLHEWLSRGEHLPHGIRPPHAA